MVPGDDSMGNIGPSQANEFDILLLRPSDTLHYVGIFLDVHLTLEVGMF